MAFDQKTILCHMETANVLTLIGWNSRSYQCQNTLANMVKIARIELSMALGSLVF